jgi:hypothetical protein
MLGLPARMEPVLGFGSVKASEALNDLVAFAGNAPGWLLPLE